MAEIEVRVRQNGKPYLRVRLKQSPASIGRDPDADVFLDSSAVSRLHARLFFDGRSVRIVDAGSTNGIRVDGVQHAKTDITPSQTVTICEFALRARAVESAAPLGEELSEGWLEMDELDDDTSVGAADTNVKRLMPQETEPVEPRHEASVLLHDADVDVDPENSYAGDSEADEDDEDDDEHTPIPEVDDNAETSADDVPSDTEHDPHEGSPSEIPSVFASTDEEDDADAERVPDDLPAMINVMRHADSELESAHRIAIEVLVSVGSRLHDVALVRPSEQYWWGGQPTFPATLWTVPKHDRFPLITHREPGTYDVQVPQESTWKMYHRGTGKAPTFRSGKLVGMRVAIGEQAEVSYGPYTVYLRCVSAPAPLVNLLDFKRWLPSPAASAAFAVAALLNVILLAMPVEPHRLFQTSAPPEHFVAFDNGERPPQQPQEIPMVELNAPLPIPEPTAELVAPPPKQTEPGYAATPTKDKKNDRPPLPIKPQKSDPDPNAGVTTIEAAPTPAKQVSIGDFRVAGLLQGVPEPMIQKGRGPPVSGGAAMLRGEKNGSSTAVMGKDGTGSTIIPPGRIEPLDLQKTINEHRREAYACYTQVGLKDNPESAGKLELQWTVDEGGQVKRVRVIVDELRSAPMTKCMTEAITRWQFPTPTGGPAVVSYPFRFTNPNL